MLLVDTNILLAAADISTPEHHRCAGVLDDHTELAIPAAVAVETAWMIESRLGPAAEAMFVASVIAVAERLGVTTIATLNRRDFAVVRPVHCDAFTLVP